MLHTKMTGRAEKPYMILITGDANTGKTCLLRCFAGEEFEGTYIATIGVDFRICTVELDGVKIKLHVWDSAGQERHRTIPSAYYRRSHGIIITYNVTKEKTFDSIPRWIEESKMFGPPNVKLMVVGTGCDCNDVDKAVDYITARDFANECQMSFFEVSAKDGTNVELAFMTFVEEIRQSLSRPK